MAEDSAISEATLSAGRPEDPSEVSWSVVGGGLGTKLTVTGVLAALRAAGMLLKMGPGDALGPMTGELLALKESDGIKTDGLAFSHLTLSEGWTNRHRPAGRLQPPGILGVPSLL